MFDEGRLANSRHAFHENRHAALGALLEGLLKLLLLVPPPDERFSSVIEERRAQNRLLIGG